MSQLAGLTQLIEKLILSSGSLDKLNEAALSCSQIIEADEVACFHLQNNSFRFACSSQQLAAKLETIARSENQHPLARFQQGENRSQPAATSQVSNLHQFRQSSLYQDNYQGSEIIDELRIPMACPEDSISMLVLFRKSPGFNSEEMEVAQLLQPILASCLKQSLQGEQPDPLSKEQLQQSGGMTGREAEIFAQLATGDTSAMVAESLGISVRTVEKHLQNIYRRLSAGSRTEAISMMLSRAT